MNECEKAEFKGVLHKGVEALKKKFGSIVDSIMAKITGQDGDANETRDFYWLHREL